MHVSLCGCAGVVCVSFPAPPRLCTPSPGLCTLGPCCQSLKGFTLLWRQAALRPCFGRRRRAPSAQPWKSTNRLRSHRFGPSTTSRHCTDLRSAQNAAAFRRACVDRRERVLAFKKNAIRRTAASRRGGWSLLVTPMTAGAGQTTPGPSRASELRLLLEQ